MRYATFVLALSASLRLVSDICAQAPSTGTAELLDARKIWDAAPHNAFTDLVRHRDQWFCVFREGTGHVPGSNGTIRVLKSSDGMRWSSAALVAERGVDLRDPKISVTPDGRLLLLVGGSIYAGDESTRDRRFVSARTRVAFSADGSKWTAPQPVAIDNQWLWRLTWREGVAYGFAYSTGVANKDLALTLWRTRDGLEFERVAVPKTPSAFWPSEAAIRFRSDGTMITLVRGEQPDRHAFIGTSVAPYREWRWQDAGGCAQGPDFTVLPDGRMFYAGRDYPSGVKTVFGVMTLTNLSPLLTLPSGGDTSYPGLVWHDGLVWMSYYASHEGKSAIYLTRVRPPRAN